MTAWNVLARKGIDKPGCLGQEEFMGRLYADLGTHHNREPNRPESRAGVPLAPSS
jgi:hypothetical protein